MTLGRMAAGAMLAAGALVVGSASPAGAQEPGLGLPSHPGVFTAANVPVHAEPVDGWACHWFGDCRTEERTRDDPGPVWFSGAARERAEIECRFGAYYKISQGERGGWVTQSRIVSGSTQPGRDLFQWWL
ncbi:MULTISPECIES: hypothetical protein [unclassified Pseudonocardia]|uniref:hypothetical protein n=1 Tax=unclassified Pseudonocardia TaxID=2619320 RepID=UPI00095D40A6|nr:MULTISPECIES: hypothetical protein [unclassified Pseudonocardia]MBN9099337.1 hypothetical protein [Pseudonocardia sp.]OJY49039.1 MAG: hypothetical protein BGP03_05435 [Pseudonocardia sp. 73-21]